MTFLDSRQRPAALVHTRLRPFVRVVGLGAVALAVLALAAPTPAEAQPSNRLRILDACVYDLYFEQGSSDGVHRRCQCAANKAVRTVTDQEIASYRIGSRLTGSLRQKIYAELATCS